jgi:hypothetical protein
MMAVIEDEAALSEPAVALWAPGSVVLVADEDASGQAALAMWQVSPDAHPTGAWVVPEQSAYGNTSTACHLLVGLERRALVVDGSTRADEIVNALTRVAGIGAERWWTGQRFSPVNAFKRMQVQHQAQGHWSSRALHRSSTGHCVAHSAVAMS